MKITETLPKFFSWLQFQRNDNDITVKWYRRAMNPFIKTMGDLPVNKINQDTIWAWREKMEERELMENTKRHYIRGLRVFLIFCKEQGWTKIDIEKIALPKVGKKKVLYLNADELKMWFESIKDVRWRAINEMFLSTGARLKELVNMNREDLQDGEIKILGKGNKERIVFISSRARMWLNKYLKTRTDNNLALFVASGGERIAKGTIENFFWKHRKIINFPKKISPHILRHSTATLMVRNGADSHEVKDFMGHSSIAITDQFYLGETIKERLKKIHKKCLVF